MKTYKDIYKFPLHQWQDHSWVSDANDNFVFQFEPRFDAKGEFLEGWKELEKKALEAINGRGFFDKEVYHKQGEIFIKDWYEPIITIRGWGNLTGTGGHNLKAEEAANIQDTFAEFIVKQLNKREPVLAV